MSTRTRLTRRGRLVVGLVGGGLVAALLVPLVVAGSGDGVPVVRSGAAVRKLVVISTIAGEATWYGPGLPADAVTASGAPFDPDAATAAHPELPFGTLVRVVRPDTGAAVVVEVNDRLPDAGPERIDLTVGAAQVLGIIDAGRADVRLEVLREVGR